MVSKRTAAALAVGFLVLISALSVWVLGDYTDSVITLPLASTGVLWAPLLWLCGIIVALSSAMAGLLKFKYYLIWIVVLIGGYLAVFSILVLLASNLLP